MRFEKRFWYPMVSLCVVILGAVASYVDLFGHKNLWIGVIVLGAVGMLLSLSKSSSYWLANISKFITCAVGITFTIIVILAVKGKLSPYEIVYLLLTLAGVGGLYVYVKKTIEIAAATRDHNAIITRPAVTVQLSTSTQLRSTLDHIWIRIKNHTAIHARIKIKTHTIVQEQRSDITVGIRMPTVKGDYNGIEEWNIPAMYDFCGHTALPQLTGKDLKANEIVILNIETETAPFDAGTYRKDPSMQYRWNDSTKEWIPFPVPKD